MRNEALCSLVEEVRLSLRLGNLEGALQKVTFYRIYRAGLKVMSEVLEACSMEDFESLFKAQKKIYVNLLNFMDEEGGEEEDDVACERASATVVVSKEGERGRVGGQFRVQDLDSALRLVRQGGTIFIESGDYTCSGQCWDVRQLAEGEGREVTLIGASTATCSISGSVRVEASRSVTFKRLKLEVGQDADSGEAVHVVRGKLILESCLVEAVSNTLLCVWHWRLAPPCTLCPGRA